MTKIILILLLITGLAFSSCWESSSKENKNTENVEAQSIDSLIVYQTENLIIKKLSNNIYQHISFLDTEGFGKVECNGIIVINGNEGVIFDTPTDNESSVQLINFIANELKSTISAIIPTHFHEDCVGGVQEFSKRSIPIYASKLTADLLKKNNQNFTYPLTTFNNILTLNIGNKKVYAEYFGEGHTKDNVIGYFPESNAVFGGCLIKTLGANKGFLGDANTDKWSETVQKIKLKYPKTEIVIPGHGEPGGTELFDYTIKLFKL